MPSTIHQCSSFYLQNIGRRSKKMTATFLLRKHSLLVCTFPLTSIGISNIRIIHLLNLLLVCKGLFSSNSSSNTPSRTHSHPLPHSLSLFFSCSPGALLSRLGPNTPEDGDPDLLRGGVSRAHRATQRLRRTPPPPGGPLQRCRSQSSRR